MDQYERLHAMMYADHATKIYQLEKYKQIYPHLFKHVVVETRPAESSRDYYVPPSLREIRPCLVVEKLAWNAKGCRFVACFPFKSYEEPCQPNVDTIHWVRLDNSLYVQACQPACDRGLSLDTYYRDGDCYVVNQAKKLFVMYPERYMGKVAKHVRLKYDDVQDRLILDEVYCRAYGLRYDPEARDCYLPTSQYIAELFIGSSVYRRHLQYPSLAKFLNENINNDPPPGSLEPSVFEEAWTKVPRSVDRTTDHPHEVLETDLDPEKSPESIADIATDVIADVAADLGIQVAAQAVKHRWLTRISSKLARKVLVENGLKHAFLHGVVKAAGTQTAIRAASNTTAHLTTKTASTVALRSATGAVMTAFTIYGVATLVVDLFDPYEYGRVLNKEQVDKIDRLLDLRYFETNDFRDVKMTPEDVWNVLQDDEDVEEELTYYGDRFDEYLKALQTVPGHHQWTRRKVEVASTNSYEKHRVFKKLFHWLLIIGFLWTSLFFWRYVDVLALILWAVLAWMGKI